MRSAAKAGGNEFDANTRSGRRASRMRRWLDGVGVGGVVTLFLVASFWSLASLWATGWNRGGAIAVVSVLVLMSIVGVWYRRALARGHKRTSTKRDLA